MNPRPKLIVEKAMNKEIEWPKDITFPHCDPRALHLPFKCVYCSKAVELQKEREDLDVSNTGETNRSWPCPGDRERGLKSLNSWHGNRAYTEKDLEEQDKYWKEFNDRLAKDLEDK